MWPKLSPMASKIYMWCLLRCDILNYISVEWLGAWLGKWNINISLLQVSFITYPLQSSLRNQSGYAFLEVKVDNSATSLKHVFRRCNNNNKNFQNISATLMLLHFYISLYINKKLLTSICSLQIFSTKTHNTYIHTYISPLSDFTSLVILYICKLFSMECVWVSRHLASINSKTKWHFLIPTAARQKCKMQNAKVQGYQRTPTSRQTCAEILIFKKCHQCTLHTPQPSPIDLLLSLVVDIGEPSKVCKHVVSKCVGK